MKLGLFTPVFGKLDAKAMLAKVRALEKVQAIELGTGGWPGHDHLDVDALLADTAAWEAALVGGTAAVPAGAPVLRRRSR